jgi:hypothetical protein
LSLAGEDDLRLRVDAFGLGVLLVSLPDPLPHEDNRISTHVGQVQR